jgi:hypothetical protein
LRCKVCVGARGRVGALGAPQSRASVALIIIALPRVRQQNDLQARNTRRPTLPDHSPFRPHFLVLSFFLSFIPLVYISSFYNLPTPRLYHAAAVRSFFYLVLVLPLCAYTSLFINIHSPSPALPRSPLRYKTRHNRPMPSSTSRRVVLYYMRAIFDRSSFFNQAVLSPFRFPFYSPACLSFSAIVRWNRCPHDLGRSLALGLSL